MNNNANALESILFAAGDPVPISRISLVLGISEDEVLDAFEELNNAYIDGGHSLTFVRLGNKLQMCSSPEYANIISKILESRKPPMLSNSALETLAIIAYFQPTTSAYVNKVRGVDSLYSIGTLCDKGLVAQKGRLDAPGRPILYETTDIFLRTMGISSLNELPPLPELQQNDAMEKLMLEIEHLSSFSDGSNSTLIPGQIEIDEQIQD